MKRKWLAVPLVLFPALAFFIPSSESQEQRWITVQIQDIREGVPDDRGNRSFAVTVLVRSVGCERATLELTSSAQFDGDNRTWKTSDSFQTNPGGTEVSRQLLVSESSLRNPPVGVPVQFAVNGRGYYKVKEMQQVEYIEYVPVTHTTPGYVVPGGYGDGHHY